MYRSSTVFDTRPSAGSQSRASRSVDRRARQVIRSCARPRLGDIRLSETTAVAGSSAQCKRTLPRRVGRVRGARSCRNRPTMHSDDDGQHRGGTTQARCAELETQKIVESGRRRSSRRVGLSCRGRAHASDTVPRRLEGRNSRKRRSASGASTRLSASLLARIFEQF